MKRKKIEYHPKDIVEITAINGSGYSKEEINQAVEIAKEEYAKEQDKKLSILQKLGILWTFITTGYMICATISFIVEGFIDSTIMYVIIAALVVYLGAFIALIALSIQDAKKVKTKLKTYKKLLAIFKAFSNIAMLTLTATTMAGLAQNASGAPALVEWLMFGVTFFVAVVQCAIKLATFIISSSTRYVAKRYKVKVVNFIDGKVQKNSTKDKMTERKYK